MPRTKNAFAFRDFDAEKILQRKFFQNLNLPKGTDEEILQKMGMADFDSFEETQAKLEAMEALLRRTAEYQKHVVRHGDRLTRYVRAVEHTITTDDKADIAALKKRHFAATNLVRKYSGHRPVEWAPPIIILGVTASADIGRLCDKIAARYKELDEKIKTHYRKIFATRLKRVRKEMRLTQTELGMQLGLSQRAISNFENAVHEPSLAILVKISEKLKRPVGWFLGAS